ncbi:uncharacterized protein LOC126780790 isoform X2 [Nymphalis io]|uniref:uncharacterized protein LOC126780790 isoform X2 n=1 Tax=Inachis io TaxID=171585 RepID=UPI00216912DA|nr:uncharacterized protein LOC126780790 isoform X2 [Nymphalis io]
MDERKMYACMARYIFCMCIMLYYHRCLVLGMIQRDTTTNIEAFDEQKALQQALLLVELLKSENQKIERAPATPLVHHWPRRVDSILSARRKWKRRDPQIDSNLYYDIPARRNYYNEEDKENAGGWRRFQYEDAFGPQPGGINISRTTSSASPSINSSSPLNAATTSIAGTEKDNLLTVSSSSFAVSTPKTSPSEITASVTASTMKATVTTPLTTLSRTTGRIMLLFSRKNTSTAFNVLNSNDDGKLQSKAENLVSSTKLGAQNHLKLSNGTPRDSELALSQAAAELEKELGPNFGNWKNRMTRKIPKIWQASTRVHLARSTRYPIPLPENHAFCYTNPYSALCRTFI